MELTEESEDRVSKKLNRDIPFWERVNTRINVGFCHVSKVGASRVITDQLRELYQDCREQQASVKNVKKQVDVVGQ